ncbi:uncharacterized protein LOC125655733 [Ostrea edulis]|uniref:uncharacterized protein LOC125655733 n=1 Tax=Ostrea edulis TaxID=37623 RepID=UPI0024AEB8B3|nr:uncharacterized protein LOC125655733 [Ostrea edulis]
MKVLLIFLAISGWLSICKTETPVVPNRPCCVSTYRTCFKFLDCGTRETHGEACFHYCGKRYKTCQAMTNQCRSPKTLNLEPLSMVDFLRYATSDEWRKNQHV